MDRKPLSLVQENAWTISLLIVTAIIGTVVTVWLGPWGIPGLVLPMWFSLPIGEALDQARKRRRDQSVKPPAASPDDTSESN